ncbi:MAG: hypothetical protein K0R10_953 [Alphaproteobacteria bacterium]|jgi:hypothetical protein|nr:hypothetical protein [Alphaproteobacteria bacterium]
MSYNMPPKGFLQRAFDSSSQFIDRVDIKSENLGNVIADKYDENRNPLTFAYRGTQLYLLSMAAGFAKMPALAVREASRVLMNGQKPPTGHSPTTPK